MTDKTKTISVRLPNETAEEFEKWLKDQGLTAREFITGVVNGEIDGSKDGGYRKSRGLDSVNTEKQPKTESKYRIDEEILDDLATMKNFIGGSVNEMIRLFAEGLNVGSIIYENGKLQGVSDIYLGDFKEKCRELNVDPQKALDKWVKDMN